MSGILGALVASVVRANNSRIRSLDADGPNPRDVAGLEWHRHLIEHWPTIRAEWDQFRDSGSELPRIEDLLGEDQGNEGEWRAGLLIANGRPCEPLAGRFPLTIAALRRVPGLRSALWSVLGPGAELATHRGPNAGVLRYHLGVDCGSDAALELGATVVRYGDRVGLLFDDTAPHAAWNRGPSERVTLFCEILRPLPPVADLCNRAVQWLLARDARYRLAPRRAAGWDAALNG